MNLGSAFGEKKLYQEAIACFEQTLRINPKNIKAYNNIGVTYARMKKWEDARRVWEKAIEINPANKEAQDNLRKLKSLASFVLKQ